MITIKENVLLAPYTTFKTGGRARFFVEVKNDVEVADAISFAREKSLSIFPFSGGSNILIGDDGFSGLVVHIKYEGISFEPVSDSSFRLLAGAGVIWDDVVLAAVDKKLWGIENLSGIPGTVGGAVVGNIGAYGQEVKDTLDFVKVFDCITREEKIFSASELHLSYRSSLFKTKGDKRYVVIMAAFKLSLKSNPVIEYKDLNNYFEGKSSLEIKDIREAVLLIRSEKLPDWKEVSTVGSYFKNPYVAISVYESLKVRFPKIPPARNENGMVKISAAWILDKVCGLKGFKSGNVSTHDHQALVVIASKDATSKEIRSFGDMLIEKVFDATGIILEPEVEFVGNF